MKEAFNKTGGRRKVQQTV